MWFPLVYIIAFEIGYLLLTARVAAITWYSSFSLTAEFRDLYSISQEMLGKVEKELDNRQSDCLEFDSPSEVLNDVKKITNLC